MSCDVKADEKFCVNISYKNEEDEKYYVNIRTYHKKKIFLVLQIL